MATRPTITPIVEQKTTETKKTTRPTITSLKQSTIEKNIPLLSPQRQEAMFQGAVQSNIKPITPYDIQQQKLQSVQAIQKDPNTFKEVIKQNTVLPSIQAMPKGAKALPINTQVNRGGAGIRGAIGEFKQMGQTASDLTKAGAVGIQQGFKSGTENVDKYISQNIFGNAKNIVKDLISGGKVSPYKEEDKKYANLKMATPLFEKTQTYKDITQAQKEGTLTQEQEVVLQLGENIGKMLPAIGVTMLTKNAKAGQIIFGASAARDYYDQAKAEGKNELSSNIYGGIMGTVEVLLEKIGYNPFKTGLVKRGLTGIIKNSLGEGLEESVTEWIDAVVKKGMFKEDIDAKETFNNSIISGAYGIALGMIMSGADAGIQSSINIKNKITNNQPITQVELDKALNDYTTAQQTETFEEMMKEVISNNSSMTEQIIQPTEKAIKPIKQKPKETTTNKIIEIDNEKYELNDAKNIKRVNIGTDFYRNIRNLFKEESANKITGDFDKAKLENVNANNKDAQDLKVNIVDKYNIQKGSKDSALVQKYGEGIISLEQLKQQSPTKWKEIIEADKYFRNKYNDFIDNINNARKEIYPNVEKKISEYEMKLQKTNDNIIAKQKELQSINKNTTKYQDTKNQIKNLELRAKSYQDILDSDELLRNKRIPKRKDYYRHFQEMAEGFSGLQNILSTTADISPKMVGISDFTKPKAKFSSIAQQRKGTKTKYDAVGGFLNYIPTANYMINIDKQISKMRTLTNELRKQMGDDTSANKAIEFLTEWTNNLAGKQTFIDRAAQKVIGRKVIKGINWTVGRIKANMILGNVSSSLSQVLNFPQIVGNIKNPIHLANGFKDMLNKNTDYSKSQFITERYKTDIMSQFETEMLDKPKKLAKFMIEVLDEKTTKLGWNAAYRQAIEKGIKNPIQYADNTMRDLVAGRGIGEKTIFQESKVIGAIMPFTVEVGNLTRVMKDFGRKKDILGLFISFVVANLLNDGIKKLGGGGSTFDPIDAIKDSLTEDDLTILERIGRIGGEVLSNIPLGQQLATIYPEYGVKSATGKQILPTRTKLFGDNDPTRFGTGGIISKIIEKPLTSIITPYGGSQLEKIRKGYEIISKGGEYKNGKLKYPVEKTTLNTLRALTMGNTKETTEFYEKDRRILSEKQTKEIEQSPNIKAAYENMMKVREYKSLLTKYKELQEAGKDITEVENKIKKLFEK